MSFEPYLELLRVKDWLAYFLMATFGFMASKGFLSPLPNIAVVYAMVILFLAFSFSINNYFDVKEDKNEKKEKNPIAAGKMNFRSALTFSGILAILGTILSASIGFNVFLFYTTLMLLSLFYSSPPLRFKSKFLLDLISHGLFFGALLFLLPLIVFDTTISLIHCLTAVSIFHFSMILELRNHMENYESDKKAGLKTTVCILGYKKSEKLLTFFIMLYSLVLFPLFLFYWQYLLPFSIVTTVFYFVFLYTKSHSTVDVYANASYGLVLVAIML